MKFQVKFNRGLIVMTLAIPIFGSCADVSEANLKSVYGMIILDQLDISASEKFGITGVTDGGRQLFAPSMRVPPKKQGMGGGTGSFGGTNLPEWVRVSWRTGDFVQRYDPITNTAWTGGEIVGNYKIEVAKRVPKEVLAYANGGRGRALRLIFRIKDDGVLFAWDVQETLKTIVDPNGPGFRVHSLHGGDIPCEDLDLSGAKSCTEGPLESAPWYRPIWVR